MNDTQLDSSLTKVILVRYTNCHLLFSRNNCLRMDNSLVKRTAHEPNRKPDHGISKIGSLGPFVLF